MPEREPPHSPPRLTRFGKWSGFALGPLAWIVDQQLVSTSSYITCPDFDNVFAISVGTICAAVAIAGFSWSTLTRKRLQRHPQISTSADLFIAAGSAGVAAISLLAIFFGTSASLILQCQR